MNGVPRRQTPRWPAADEYPEQRPRPPPERKANENGGLGVDGQVVRIISGIIWEVLAWVWFLILVAFFRFTCKFAFMYLHVTFK